MMNRMMLAFAALLVSAPALAKARPFVSDRIAVSVEGRGRDVVLVPGMTSSPAAWKYTVKQVPGYRYHLVQVKGFAGVPAEGNANGDLIKASGEEVARYIREARLKKPAVVGHSMGGSIALMIGARHPGLASRIMVVDQVPWMGIFYGAPGLTPEKLRPIADAARLQSLAQTPEARRAQYQAMTDGMVATQSERAGVVQSAMDSDQAVTAQAFNELLMTDLRPELPRIAVPVRVLYVTPRIGPAVTDAYVDQIYRDSYAGLTGVTLVRVPDSAHFVMYDNQPFFAKALKDFLTGR